MAAKDGVVLVTTPHLGPQTLLRWALYLWHREFWRGSFQVIRGRNLSLAYVQKAFRKVGLLVQACAANGPVLYLSMPARVKGIVSRLLPEARFGSFLYILGGGPHGR